MFMFAIIRNIQGDLGIIQGDPRHYLAIHFVTPMRLIESVVLIVDTIWRSAEKQTEGWHDGNVD